MNRIVKILITLGLILITFFVLFILYAVFTWITSGGTFDVSKKPPFADAIGKCFVAKNDIFFYKESASPYSQLINKNILIQTEGNENQLKGITNYFGPNAFIEITVEQYQKLKEKLVLDKSDQVVKILSPGTKMWVDKIIEMRSIESDLYHTYVSVSDSELANNIADGLFLFNWRKSDSLSLSYNQEYLSPCQ